MRVYGATKVKVILTDGRVTTEMMDHPPRLHDAITQGTICRVRRDQHGAYTVNVYDPLKRYEPKPLTTRLKI